MVDYSFMKDCVCVKALADAHAGGTSRPVQSYAIQVSLTNFFLFKNKTGIIILIIIIYSHDIYSLHRINTVVVKDSTKNPWVYVIMTVSTNNLGTLCQMYVEQNNYYDNKIN